ncbi:MAG TPA: DUF433 domain-containing protein [Ktedonobacterales bacterium]|nr:DUF433 domain-containing protein [Ktedonobacterales bacterium]
MADGDLFVGQSRVLLENIVLANQRGETPKQIQQNFPTLSLKQVYGALVYYLEHQDELDAEFADNQRALDELHVTNRAVQAEFIDSMRARVESARGQQSAISEAQSPTTNTASNT